MENEAHNMSAHRNTFKIIFYSDIECPLSLGTTRTKFGKNHMTLQHRPPQDVDVLVLGSPGNFRKLTSSDGGDEDRPVLRTPDPAPLW